MLQLSNYQLVIVLHVGWNNTKNCYYGDLMGTRSKRKRSHLKSFSSSQDGDSDSGQADSKWSKSCQGSVKHLTDYLHDREELHLQLFTIFSKKEIKGLLPDALKVGWKSESLFFSRERNDKSTLMVIV